MKICIVTVYNSENCGSYLQAYAMKTYLEKLGHEIVFLKRDVAGSSRSFSYRFMEIGKCILRRNFKQAELVVERHKKFNDILNSFRVVDLNNTDDVELFIIGSDTVWDFQDEYFRAKSDVYTGALFRNHKFITYAASCANTTLEDIKRYNVDLTSLNAADSLSVRDRGTFELIKSIINVEPEIVCDPTLLLDVTDYQTLIENSREDQYLLLYCFGMIDNGMRDQIIKFAGERNLKILSIGTAFNWVDLAIPASPFEFIKYYQKANYIITNTFHGTVFATIFHKQFAVITAKKSKIVDYLESINLLSCIVDKSSSLIPALNTRIDYQETAKRIGILCESSKMFLGRSIAD